MGWRMARWTKGVKAAVADSCFPASLEVFCEPFVNVVKCGTNLDKTSAIINTSILR